MATNDRHSGTLRTDYETDPAQLHGLSAMESSWQMLLHRLARYSKGLEYRDDDGQEGTLAPLLENHVLTVVADLMRKRLSGYDESFADAQETTGESDFHDKLETDIRRWTARLEAFIDKSWRTARRLVVMVTRMKIRWDDVPRLPFSASPYFRKYISILKEVQACS